MSDDDDGCACFYSECYDDNYPAFVTEEWRTARKQHKCCECGDPIKPGDRYEYVCGKWDSRIDVYKTCAGCENIRKSLNCGSGWTYTTLWQDIADSDLIEDKAPTPCTLRALNDAGRAKLLDAWQEHVDETVNG